MDGNGNCIDRILGEDYVDFIADYELASDDDLNSMGICYIPSGRIFLWDRIYKGTN